MKALSIWLAATAIALLLACAPLLEGPDELDAAQAVAEDTAAAPQEAAQAMHPTRIAMGAQP